jgi:hypothetical protein
MKTNKQIKLYNQYTKADRYLLGFEYNGIVYLANLTHIPNAYLFVTRASSRNGGGKKLQIRLTQKHKVRLINKGATPITLLDGYNNGDRLENTIRTMYGLEHKHDNVAFYKGVDITINDIGYSIKWENAQLCTYKTVNRLGKQA